MDEIARIRVTQENAARIINIVELEHRSFLKNLNLTGLNLAGADLSCLHISNVDFSGADLTGATLNDSHIINSIFDDAKLDNTIMYRCDVDNCSFVRANLSGCNLMRASLHNSNFASAKIRNADLVRANVFGSIFTGADLTGADIRDAEEINDSFNDAIVDYPMKCPEKGSFIGWKKCYGYTDYKRRNFLVMLEIPEDAKRVSGAERKCRCDKAIVRAILPFDALEEFMPPTETTVHSIYDPTFEYRLGETVHVNNFDDNRWHVCAPGIHFFMSKVGAMYY